MVQKRSTAVEDTATLVERDIHRITVTNKQFHYFSTVYFKKNPWRRRGSFAS